VRQFISEGANAAVLDLDSEKGRRLDGAIRMAAK
jgi:hypothetical protein